MQIIRRGEVTRYAFDARDEPVLHVNGQCAVPRVQVIEHLPGPSGKTRDGKGKYSDRLTWDLEPFCGTLATAPEREVFTSLLGQGPFGGNIDCRDVAPGHTILLNSYHEGGCSTSATSTEDRRHRVHGHRGRDPRHRAVELHRNQEQAHPHGAHRQAREHRGGGNQPADGARRLRCLRQHDRLVERGLRHQAAGHLHPHVLRSGVSPDLPDGGAPSPSSTSSARSTRSIGLTRYGRPDEVAAVVGIPCEGNRQSD